MPIILTVTNAGRAALVNAENTGTDPVTITECGVSATAVVPSVTDTALPGEIKRIATLSGDVVADDTIHMVVRDESADAFTLRSLAFYLADGTLFALYGQAGAILEKTAQSNMLLAVDVKFGDIDAALLTFGDANFLNPPATETVQGVAELATQAESDAGTDDVRIVTPKKMKTSVLAWVGSWFSDVWRASNDGSGSGLDADLLDGQQGSWYSNIVARLGFTPVNKAGDTMTGQLGVNASPVVGATSWGFFGGDVSLLNSGAQSLHFNGYYSGGAFRHGVTGEHAAAWRFDAAIGAMALWASPGTGASGANASEVSVFSITKAGAVSATSFSASGFVVWHAGNDGSGSGLDADLLDGQQGSYYLPAASYTAADVKSKLLTVDGSGSGVDADLLDGQDGSYYTNIIARLGFTPLNKAGDTMSGRLVTDANSIGGSVIGTATGGLGGIEVKGNGAGAAFMAFHRPNAFAAYLGLDIDNVLRFGGWSLGAAAFSVWHAGSDGSGSGLDADLLDGWQLTDILPEFGSNANGYWKKTRTAQGVTVIEQWGRITANPNGSTTINFPIAFTDGGSISCMCNGAGTLGNTQQDNWPVVYNIPNLSQAEVYSADNAACTVMWEAIGI
jgi:hypothetical protein